MTKEQIEHKIEVCREITTNCFSKKKNKEFYLTGEKLELQQMFAEYTQGVLQIVLGDDSITIEEFIEGNAANLSNRFKK